PIVRRLAFGVLARHAHERPTAAQALAVEREAELAVAQAGRDVALGQPGAAVPDDDRAAAVLAFRYLALERAVLERVILGLDCEVTSARRERGLLRHGPALQHAVVLEAEVVMQARRVVLLHDVGQAVVARGVDAA